MLLSKSIYIKIESMEQWVRVVRLVGCSVMVLAIIRSSVATTKSAAGMYMYRDELHLVMLDLSVSEHTLSGSYRALSPSSTGGCQMGYQTVQGSIDGASLKLNGTWWLNIVPECAGQLKTDSIVLRYMGNDGMFANLVYKRTSVEAWNKAVSEFKLRCFTRWQSGMFGQAINGRIAELRRQMSDCTERIGSANRRSQVATTKVADDDLKLDKAKALVATKLSADTALRDDAKAKRQAFRDYVGRDDNERQRLESGAEAAEFKAQQGDFELQDAKFKQKWFQDERAGNQQELDSAREEGQSAQDQYQSCQREIDYCNKQGFTDLVKRFNNGEIWFAMTKPGADIHVDPWGSSQTLGQATPNDWRTILPMKGGWYMILTKQNSAAYISADLLGPIKVLRWKDPTSSKP